MRLRMLLTMTLVGLALGNACWAIEQVVLYECPRLTAPPVIDGKADDVVWKTAALADLPYKFNAMDLTPAGSRNTFQAACDDTALYLTCTFYKDNAAPWKATRAGHDDPDLWTDDSTEIYIDPENNGRFFKFIVNCAGVYTDLRMTDAGIDYSWDATHATVAAVRDDKAWTLEMAVPWRDFGQQPAVGALWGFEILRFTGTNWATWTVGASWAHPEKFGMLSLGGGGFLGELAKLQQAIRPTKGDQWIMVLPSGMLRVQSLQQTLASAISEAALQVTEARFDANAVKNTAKRQELLAKLRPLPATLDAAAKAVPDALDAPRVQAWLVKLQAVTKEAKEVMYDARLATALE